MRTLIIILAFVFSLISCSSVLEKRIDISNIDAVTNKINKRYHRLDSFKIVLINDMDAFSKGRQQYVSYLRKTNPSKNDYDKFIVNEEKFNQARNDFFNFLKEKRLTYKQLFAEYDSATMINDKFRKDHESFYKEIDNFCVEKQKDLDLADESPEKIKEALNKMVQINITSILPVTSNNGSEFQVQLQFINKTSKPIYGLSFTIELTDKVTKKTATLDCGISKTIINDLTDTWVFDKATKSETYEQLRQIATSRAIMVQNVTKMNLGGTIILVNKENNPNGSQTNNLKYKTPKELNGYCPYIERDSEMGNKLLSIIQKQVAETEKITPVITKYNATCGSLIDYEKVRPE